MALKVEYTSTKPVCALRSHRDGLEYLAWLHSFHSFPCTALSSTKDGYRDRLRLNKCKLLSCWSHLLFPVRLNNVNFYQSKCLNRWKIEQLWWVHSYWNIWDTSVCFAKNWRVKGREIGFTHVALISYIAWKEGGKNTYFLIPGLRIIWSHIISPATNAIKT